jgi:hypothetical protein
VRNAEPMFNPSPTVLVDLLLDSADETRHEIELSDFVLRADVCRFLDCLDEMKNAEIERIDVREGTPRRILYERPLKEPLE